MSGKTNPPVTRTAGFGACCDDRYQLFAVAPGVPLWPAMEKLYILIESTLAVANAAAAATEDDSLVCAVVHLLETIRAGAGAIFDGLPGAPEVGVEYGP